VTAEELGGARHTTKSGVADGAYRERHRALTQMRRLIDFLPRPTANKPRRFRLPGCRTRDDISLDTLIPTIRTSPTT
jgi:propionyl-CoA carboxylase beta chain